MVDGAALNNVPGLRGARRRLVEALQAGGIRDLSVLRAFDEVPRHLFVPTGMRHRAYADSALPIGQGQTISQPSMHARYLELLQLTGHEKVLEIGTGSGYQSSVLSYLTDKVYTIEIIDPLAEDQSKARTEMRSIADGLVVSRCSKKLVAPGEGITMIAGKEPLAHRKGPLLSD